MRAVTKKQSESQFTSLYDSSSWTEETHRFIPTYYQFGCNLAFLVFSVTLCVCFCVGKKCYLSLRCALQLVGILVLHLGLLSDVKCVTDDFHELQPCPIVALRFLRTINKLCLAIFSHLCYRFSQNIFHAFFFIIFSGINHN